MQTLRTSSPGRFHQFSAEKISTSCRPAEPALSRARRMDRRSMTPSPIIPRSNNRSLCGIQPVANMMSKDPLGRACALDLGEEFRIPPDVVNIYGDSDALAEVVA